ncbi:hypothetical protein DSJ55_00005, partial [Mycobacterium tuberculosis]
MSMPSPASRTSPSSRTATRSTQFRCSSTSTSPSAPFTSSSTFPPCRGSGIRPVLRRRVSSTPVRVGC